MIIGHGDLAKVLTPYDKPDRIYFASGVSNSKCNDNREFGREILLLQKTLTDYGEDKQLIYFGTLSMFYSDTPYTRHKRIMESLIKDYFNRWTIIRLGNITWGCNPNTIINYFKAKIKSGESFEVYDSFRYLCSQEDFEHWVSLIPSFNCELNITGMRMKISEIVEEIKNERL